MYRWHNVGSFWNFEYGTCALLLNTIILRVYFIKRIW